MSIKIQYNGDKNRVAEYNHITYRGVHQLEREFNSVDEAICFWLECEFYSGAITTLDEILPKGYNSELLNILEERPIKCEEVLLETKELYQLTEQEDD